MKQTAVRQRTTLWNLRETLKEGVDDSGRPLSDSAKKELRADIAQLEEKLQPLTP